MASGSVSWLGIRGLIKPIVGLGFLKVAALLLTTMASIIVARQLGPAAYGQVTFVLAVMSLLSIPSNDALAPLLVREVSVYEQAKKWALLNELLTWSRKVALASVLVVIVPLVVWALVLLATSDDSNAVLFLIGAPLLIVWALAGRVSNVFLGLRRTVLAQCFDWFASPGIYLLFICALWFVNLLNSATVLVSSVLSIALSVLAGYVVLKKSLSDTIHLKDGESSERNWLASWRYFIFIQFVSVANMRAPVLLMGFLSDDVEIGLYRVAENIASLVAVSLLIVNIVLGPVVSRLYADRQLTELGRIARSTARIALGVTLPAVLVIGFFGEWIVGFVFGGEYSGANTPLTLLLIGQVFNVACGSVGLILNMTGLEQRALRIWFIALMVNILLCMVLIPAYGATGAAASAVMSTIVWNVLLLVFIRKLLGINVAAV